MTKKELIAIVADEAGITKKAAKTAIDSFLGAVTKDLADGNQVALAGFGTFKVKERQARTGINPKTKAPVSIPACSIPSFKPGKAFKDAVAK